MVVGEELGGELGKKLLMRVMHGKTAPPQKSSKLESKSRVSGGVGG